MGWAYLRQLSEDPGLEVWDFGHGFNDKVDVRKVFDLGAGGEALAGGGGVFFGDAAFANVFLQELVGELEALIDGGLGAVDDADGDGGALGGDESYSKAL